jgi:hypothetical protein
MKTPENQCKSDAAKECCSVDVVNEDLSVNLSCGKPLIPTNPSDKASTTARLHNIKTARMSCDRHLYRILTSLPVGVPKIQVELTDATSVQPLVEMGDLAEVYSCSES